MIRKPAHALASLCLVALGATACGGSSTASTPAGPPTDASAQDFCGAVNWGVEQASSVGDPTKDPSQAVTFMHTWAGRLQSAGTPKDMPADARKGYEIIVGKLAKLTASDIQNQLQSLSAGLSAADQKSVDALSTYQQTECKDYPPKVSLPSGVPSGEPSVQPSVQPSAPSASPS